MGEQFTNQQRAALGICEGGENLPLWNDLLDMILDWEDNGDCAGDLAAAIIAKLRAYGWSPYRMYSPGTITYGNDANAGPPMIFPAAPHD